MYDIFYVGLASSYFNQLKQSCPSIKKADTFADAKKKSLTRFFWIIPDDVVVADEFKFNYVPDEWSNNYVHVFRNDRSYDGICLVPKTALITNSEIKHRVFVNKKEIDIVASYPKKYDIFEIDTYDEYLTALETSSTEMFWMSSRNIAAKIPNIYFDHSNLYDRKQNHAFIHQVNDQKLYNGVFLCSKHRTLSKKEVEHRHIVNRKEWDIVASYPKKYNIFEIDTYDEYLTALETSSTEMFWMVPGDVIVSKNFKYDIYFSHDQTYERHINHVFLNGKHHDGVVLCSKKSPLSKKEVEHRHIVNRKEWDIIVSTPKLYDIFEIDTYDEYLTALNKSTTEMFWMSSRNIAAKIPNIYFDHSNLYDRKQNHAFIHQVNDQKLYNGVFLCSKHRTLSKKEVEHRHIVNRKEWDIVASYPKKYNIFEIDTYDEYLTALETSSTEMFWMVPGDVIVSKNFKYDIYFSHDQTYERHINHVFLNGKHHDGVVLCSKKSKFSKREFDYRFISHKKEWPALLSLPKPYDVVFISYQEPNADENYKALLKKVPTAKRIHKVKGIHQAHIAAAQLCKTDMIWIVDGDAKIVDDFNFDYQVAKWDQETVHVWRSQNPINELIYGYGGVKLFPRNLTITMDMSKPDMTTSISSKFKAMHQISNITAFNTDPFSTWRSAFRECAKLSSKIIDRQKDDETNRRLQTWCTIGLNQPYGNYAIDGAKTGAAYGARNQDNLEALKKINDFEWLQEKFNENF
jgi:hypothetical protein